MFVKTKYRPQKPHFASGNGCHSAPSGRENLTACDPPHFSRPHLLSIVWHRHRQWKTMALKKLLSLSWCDTRKQLSESLKREPKMDICWPMQLYCICGAAASLNELIIVSVTILWLWWWWWPSGGSPSLFRFSPQSHSMCVCVCVLLFSLKSHCNF